MFRSDRNIIAFWICFSKFWIQLTRFSASGLCNSSRRGSHCFQETDFSQGIPRTGAFLGPESSLNERRSNSSNLRNDDAKITPIARFVNEGVNQQNRVIYYHSNDEATAREE